MADPSMAIAGAAGGHPECVASGGDAGESEVDPDPPGAPPLDPTTFR